jgi:two-component system, NarL family, invasion response regulator UvrY
MLFSMHPKHLFSHTLEQYPKLLFCQKNANEEHLIQAVELLLNITDQPNILKSSSKTKNQLSKTEEQVLQFLLDGKSTNDIAYLLNLKSNTISTYKRRIFDKTQTSNILELSKIYR